MCIVLKRRLLLTTMTVMPWSAGYGTTGSARARTGLHKVVRPKSGSYATFLDSIRSQALARGVSAPTLSRALSLTTRPNERVLKLDRHQPEFTLTWSQYRERVIGSIRVSQGKDAWQQRKVQLAAIGEHYGVDPRVIVGIWGLESGFGRKMGTFSIIDALATLSFDGRRSAFFRSELFKALHILDQGDIQPEAMLGSYAGAMGQPQFMPSAYLRYAVDYDRNGRRDIWTSEPDVFASIANYLHECGWQKEFPWGQPVQLTAEIDQSRLGRGNRKSLADWTRLGVRRTDGQVFSRQDVSGAILRPDGAGTEAFMIYENFDVIRRYNPSDFYALGVGLLGYAVA